MRSAALFGLVLVVAAPLAAQSRPALSIERADGRITPVEMVLERGYAAVPLQVFRDLGWAAQESAGGVTIAIPNEILIELTTDSPFFRWDGLVLQLTDAPYRNAGQVLVPAQLLTDFLPRRLPDLYEYDGLASWLRAGDPVPGRGSDGATRGTADDAPPPADEAPVAALPSGPSPYDGPRVVIIDAGHGGADPGALGPRGLREKDIALGIALEVARVLRQESNLEVHMTREDDSFVDIWQRGEIATEIKGERPGLFVSIHANSFPNNRSARGFETYFLSEARTEHERRVSAIENAPVSFQGQNVDVAAEPDLGFILRELRNLDHQHWSALLAQFVQEELGDFHPGPDRGVKQGVLAVLTNALMPSVLVEAGYLSNGDEARVLGENGFQRQAGQAIARAVVRFFGRYPPGSTASGGSGEDG